MFPSYGMWRDDMAAKDPESFAYYALRVVAVVIVALVCGVEGAGIIGGLL